jgi:hypothetical protein
MGILLGGLSSIFSRQWAKVLWKVGAIDDFNKNFLALVASAGHLNKLHLENIMSAITLTRAYEWCTNIVADPS